MTDESPNLNTIRRINDALDVGAAEDGQQVVVNLRMEDGTTEWFAIQHSKVGRLIAGLKFAASVAAKDRPKLTQQGNQLPEMSTVIDITGVNASSAPGENFVCLRMEIGEGVNLDFRIPLESVAAIQEKLAAATSLAQSGKPSQAH